jgi:two-component system, response regulator PdtaR
LNRTNRAKLSGNRNVPGLMDDSKTPTAAVLIVEDEPSIRSGTASFIEDAGFIIYEAGSADEAIRMLELHDEIRLIFTDINMPGSMNGLKLAHYVRGRWPPVRIIVTSGRAPMRDLPAGAVFVEKPYHPGHLAAKFREMLAEAA